VSFEGFVNPGYSGWETCHRLCATFTTNSETGDARMSALPPVYEPLLTFWWRTNTVWQQCPTVKRVMGGEPSLPYYPWFSTFLTFLGLISPAWLEVKTRLVVSVLSPTLGYSPRERHIPDIPWLISHTHGSRITDINLTPLHSLPAPGPIARLFRLKCSTHGSRNCRPTVKRE